MGRFADAIPGSDRILHSLVGPGTEGECVTARRLWRLSCGVARKGFTEQEVDRMSRLNPARLLGLP